MSIYNHPGPFRSTKYEPDSEIRSKGMVTDRISNHKFIRLLIIFTTSQFGVPGSSIDSIELSAW